MEGDADRDELTGAVESTDLSRVLAIMLAPIPGPDGNQRRRDDVTMVPPAGDLTMEHIAGAARFVAGADLAAATPTVEETLELTQIVG